MRAGNTPVCQKNREVMQAQSQHITRVNKLDNNLKDQIEWLSLNLEKSYFSGFNYAHTASKDVIAPIVFNFDNPSKRASNSSTLASLSEIGDFELQSFRLSSNLKNNNTTERPANGNVSYSSASLSSEFEDHVGAGDQDPHRSNNYSHRPSVGSFLGLQGTAVGFLPGASDREQNKQSYATTSSSFSRLNNGGSYGSVGNGPSTSATYGNISKSFTNDSSGFSNYSNTRNSSTVAIEAFTTSISDSQLADLDIDGMKHISLYPL